MGFTEEFAKAKSNQAELEEMIAEFLQSKSTGPLQAGYDPPRCKTCAWFKPRFPVFEFDEGGIISRPQSLGHCRKRAPGIRLVDGVTALAFPPVTQHDYCGDHLPSGAPV